MECLSRVQIGCCCCTSPFWSSPACRSLSWPSSPSSPPPPPMEGDGDAGLTAGGDGSGAVWLGESRTEKRDVWAGTAEINGPNPFQTVMFSAHYLNGQQMKTTGLWNSPEHSDTSGNPASARSTDTASGGGGGVAARMNPEAATELVRKGSTLLLLDVPQRTLFGIDTQVFSVGPKFKGMKMVPPGPHFVYYCSSSRSGNEFAPTVGFFLTTQPSEVIVRKWDAQEERLIKLSEEEEIRYSEAVKRFEFDDQLGPYNLDSYGDWKQLSNYLSQSAIERLEPIGGEITIALESSWMDKAPQSDMERRLMEQLRESKFAKNAPVQAERKGCYYTSIPGSVKHKNVSGGDLTALNLDKTSLLESVLGKNYQDQEDLLLGELQFAFIAFMMGQSLEAFMQWKALVSLLLSCSEAPLHTRTNLFVKFLKTFYYQLKLGFQRTQDSRSEDVGNSLFLDEAWFSRDVFLYRLSKDFFTVVFEAPVVDGDLLSWARKLKTLLETTFGWDLEDNAVNLIDEDDEFAPVVVEMDGS